MLEGITTVANDIVSVLDKSTQGTPAKYSYCVAENEEESPWAPYHVEKGYRLQLNVMEGNYKLARDVCPWWDATAPARKTG